MKNKTEYFFKVWMDCYSYPNRYYFNTKTKLYKFLKSFEWNNYRIENHIVKKTRHNKDKILEYSEYLYDIEKNKIIEY